MGRRIIYDRLEQLYGSDERPAHKKGGPEALEGSMGRAAPDRAF